MNDLAIFYDDNWTELADEIKIIKNEFINGIFSYVIHLKNDVLEYSKPERVVDTAVLLVVIPKTYSRDVYNYCVHELAHMQGCTIGEIVYNFAYEPDLEEELIDDDFYYEYVDDAY